MLRTLAITSTAITVVLAGLVVVSFTGCPQTVGEGEGEGEGEGVAGEGEGVAGEGEGEGVSGEGEGEGGACAPTPTCTDAPTSSLSFTNVNNEPAIVADNGAPIAVGATRAAVEAAIGTGVKDGFVAGGSAGNAFHVDYCAGGFQIQYVDGDGVFDQASAGGAGTDVVARIQTLTGAHMTPPNFTADATFNAGGDVVHIASTAGVEDIEDANATLLTVVLFKPQANATSWSLAFDDTPDGQQLGALSIGNGSFVDVKNALGSAFDADGTTDIDLGFTTITVRTLIYASTGIRVSGICGGDCSDGNVSLNTVFLSPPFFGVDAHGLALGSSEAAVDAANIGPKSGPDNNGITIYGATGIGKAPTGVAFVQAPDCSNVAATFVLGYTTQ